MTEWIYFIHPPRDDFAATMTDDEKAVWAEHFERLQRLLADGQLILAGCPCGSFSATKTSPSYSLPPVKRSPPSAPGRRSALDSGRNLADLRLMV